MGVSKESNKRIGNYFKIKHGGITRESKTEMPEDQGWVYRSIQKPNTNPPEFVDKWLDIYPKLSGLITLAEWYDTGDQYKVPYTGIKLKIRDVETNEAFYLDLPAKSKSFSVFVKLMENIDYSKEVIFHAWEDLDKETNQKKTAFYVEQNGAAIKWKYTRANMGDCPPPKKNRTGGWDFAEQTEWLLDKFDFGIVPKLQELYPDEKFDESVEIPPDEEEFSGPPQDATVKADEVSADDIKNLRKGAKGKATAEPHWTEELVAEKK